MERLYVGYRQFEIRQLTSFAMLQHANEYLCAAPVDYQCTNMSCIQILHHFEAKASVGFRLLCGMRTDGHHSFRGIRINKILLEAEEILCCPGTGELRIDLE